MNREEKELVWNLVNDGPQTDKDWQHIRAYVRHFNQTPPTSKEVEEKLETEIMGWICENLWGSNIINPMVTCKKCDGSGYGIAENNHNCYQCGGNGEHRKIDLEIFLENFEKINFNNIKQYISQLEESVIEGNQNLQEKMVKLQSKQDAIREVCKKDFVSCGYGDLQNIILSILDKQ